ncbi:uncharacterized protein [Argopecten irradians]|uniref:uncharacterized protein n=1 Tax=Argopecten irradians TaxID=31199 RepID=UPI0037226127
MKIAVGLTVILGTLLLMNGSSVSGQVGGLSPDILKTLNDSQVVLLLADTLLQNPILLHKLEPIPFSIGPVMSEISKLQPPVSSALVPWVLDSLPTWLNNPHFLKGVKSLVKNINEVNTTDLLATRNYTILMYGIVARTNYTNVIGDFLLEEGTFGLEPHIAAKIVPWVLENIAGFLSHDGPAAAKILVDELNAMNLTGLEKADPATAVTEMIHRLNFSDMLGKLYQLSSIKGIAHSAFRLIGLDPVLGDTLLPEVINGFVEIANLTLQQINQLNLTAMADLYHKNITDPDLLKTINYLDILKSTFLSKLGPVVLTYVRNNSEGLLKLFVEELNLVSRKNVVFFIFNKPTLANLLLKFDWGEFLTKFLERFGKPVFDLVGLNPIIGKVLAPVIAKDIPNILKFTIQDLNRIDVTLVQNPPNGTTPLVVIVKELDITNILHEFIKLKGLEWDDVMGLNTATALMLLDWTSVRVIGFLKNETYDLFSRFVEEVKLVNTSGLNPSNPEEYAGGIMSRLAWSSLLADIIGEQKDLLFSLLNLNSLQNLDTGLVSRIMQPVLGVLPNVLTVVSDSLADANFTSIPTNASVMDIVRQVNIQTLWRDVIKMILPPVTAPSPNPKYNLRKAVLKSTQVQEFPPMCGPDSREFLMNAISETWAMEMLDAAGKPTPGLLKGSLHMMGNYDECVAIKANLFTEDNTTRTFGGRYCRVAFDLPKSLLVSLVPSLENQKLYGMKTTLSLGVCLPDSCSSGDVVDFFETGVAAGLGLTPLSVTCDESLDLASDQDAILVLAITAAIILLVIIASVTHICKWGRRESRDHMSGPHNYEDYHNAGFVDAYESLPDPADSETDSKATATSTTTTTSFSNGSTKGLVSESSNIKATPESLGNGISKSNRFDDVSNPKFEKKPDLGKRIVLSFSAIQSIRQLMTYRRQSDAIDCIHGIRTLSILWIMLGNTYIYNILPITDSPLAVDMLDTLDIMKRFTFQAVMGAHYGVDTFLMISGCLITYSMMSRFAKFGKFKWKTLLSIVFQRYIRLTPAYIMVLVIFVYWYRYLGTGPSWPDKIMVAEKCRTDWWHHLLYINNLVGVHGNDAFHQCMTWSFFLALLMQFYLITPILLLMATFSFRLAGTVLILLMAAGITSAGVKEYEYGGDLLSMIDDNGDYWNNVFIAPWCRVSSYCIGMMLGLALLKFKERKRKLPLWGAIIGWVSAIVIGVFVVYVNYTKYQPELEEWTRDMEAAYEALGRPLWCISVAWVIYACYTGRGGLIDAFLSWRGFLPLSRLTFSVYLVHPIWMVFYMYTDRSLIYLLRDYSMTYLFLGHTVMSFAIAFVVAVVFEKPFCNLARAVFKKK